MLQIGPDGGLGIQLPGLGPFLAQGHARAQGRSQALHFFAQALHVMVGKGTERPVHQVIQAFAGWAVAHVFGNALAGILAQLVFQGLLVGLQQLAHLVHPLLVHAQLLRAARTARSSASCTSLKRSAFFMRCTIHSR